MDGPHPVRRTGDRGAWAELSNRMAGQGGTGHAGGSSSPHGWEVPVGALPRPELSRGAHRDLVEALHVLHHRAGWPSLRTLARATGVSHTTVSTVFSSPKLPSWGI